MPAISPALRLSAAPHTGSSGPLPHTPALARADRTGPRAGHGCQSGVGAADHDAGAPGAGRRRGGLTGAVEAKDHGVAELVARSTRAPAGLAQQVEPLVSAALAGAVPFDAVEDLVGWDCGPTPVARFHSRNGTVPLARTGRTLPRTQRGAPPHPRQDPTCARWEEQGRTRAPPRTRGLATPERADISPHTAQRVQHERLPVLRDDL